MLNKKFQALFLIGMLFSTINLFSQCTHCSNPAVPAEYGGTFTKTLYKNATLQLWAAKPATAVDGRDWFKVKSAGDTTFVGSGDTLTVSVDTTCKYIAHNINNCSCGGTYYSAYVIMANVTMVDSPSIPQFWLSYAPVVCSGSSTNIVTYTNSNLSGIFFQYYRDDTSNVSGSVTGTASVGPLGITLTNKTASPQIVRFLVRMYKNGGAYFDSRSFYLTVTPDSPSTGDHCIFPSKPGCWPLASTDVSTYAKGAHVQFFVDTSVIATAVNWYKVLGTDTSYAGSGYSINVTIDTPCQYLAQNSNYCNCDSSIYYSAYTLVANFSVSNSYVTHIFPLQYMPTIASGTGIDIVPRTDSTVAVTMALNRDNALVTGSTSQYTVDNALSGTQSLDLILTNTTNSPQLVRYVIRSKTSSSVFGDTYMGYITVLPSSMTAPSGNHCKVPGPTWIGGGGPVVLPYAKNAIINLDIADGSQSIGGAVKHIANTADSIDWYKVRGPGDTVLVGTASPVNTTVDTPFMVIAVSRNVCYWSDSSLHIYKSAPWGLAQINVGSNPDNPNGVSNSTPNVCGGTAANISTIGSGTRTYYWYRSNIKNVGGTAYGSASSSTTGITINPTLTDSVTTPQKVYFVTTSIASANYYSQSITSVMVYPDCSQWAGLATAVHSLKDSICAGDTATLTADTLPGYGSSHYAWSSGDTTQTIHPTIAGTYTVTVTNGCGCTATATKIIGVNGGSNLVTSTSIAHTQINSTGIITIQTTGGIPPYNYQWQNLPSLVRDSVGIYDSLSMLTMNMITSNQCWRYGLDTGWYHIIIADSGCGRSNIDIHVGKELPWSLSTGIIASGPLPGDTTGLFLGRNFLTRSNVDTTWAPGGFMSTEPIDPGHDGSLTITNLTGDPYYEQYAGLTALDSPSMSLLTDFGNPGNTFSAVTHYFFYFKNNNYYTMDEDGLSAALGSCSVHHKYKVSKEGNHINYLVDDSVIKTLTITTPVSLYGNGDILTDGAYCHAYVVKY